MKTLKDIDAKGKRVFYRPDYNVPYKEGKIQDDFRIQATFPTLDLLIKQGAKIIIGSHMGRPDGQRNPEFEMRPVAERLADKYTKQTVRLAHEVTATEVDAAISEMAEGDILVLPNLRFFAEEEANDETFAKSLAGLADLYVNDAFACDHRAHASIVGVPKEIPGFAGYLLEKELEHLGMLLEKPKSPFVVIMGGAKVSDKIEVIRALGKVADKLLIGGAMANTFLLAKGEDIGKSKAETDKVELAKELITELGDKLYLAEDYAKKDVDGGFSYLDIGPKAIEAFKKELKDAKTIFWNGSLGYIEDPEYAKATNEIASFIGDLKGVASVVAGGDTVETVTKLKIHDKFTFVSTGGGAALEFLAGEKLPGVEVLQ
jgi:phosphoglycerate kinase